MTIGFIVSHKKIANPFHLVISITHDYEWPKRNPLTSLGEHHFKYSRNQIPYFFWCRVIFTQHVLGSNFFLHWVLIWLPLWIIDMDDWKCSVWTRNRYKLANGEQIQDGGIESRSTDNQPNKYVNNIGGFIIFIVCLSLTSRWTFLLIFAMHRTVAALLWGTSRAWIRRNSKHGSTANWGCCQDEKCATFGIWICQAQSKFR